MALHESHVPIRNLLFVNCGSSHREFVLNQIINIPDIQINPILLAYDHINVNWTNNIFQHKIVAKQNATHEEIAKMVSQYCQKEKLTLHNICCYDDFYIELAAYLCEEFSIPKNTFTPFEIIQKIKDKSEFRIHCNTLTDVFYSTWSIVLSNMDDFHKKELRFPSVLKPQKGAGSYFCCKYQNKNDLEDDLPEAFRKLHEYNATQPDGQLLPNFVLEEIVSGHEFDVDGFCVNSELKMAHVADNIETGKFCQEDGCCYPSVLSQSIQSKIRSSLQDLLKSFSSHYCTGVFHFEGIITENEEIFPIELNMRLGGAEAPKCVQFCTGTSLPVAVGKLALGIELPAVQFNSEPEIYARSTNERLETEGIISKIEIDPELVHHPNYVGHCMYVKEGGVYRSKSNGSIGTAYWLAASGENPEIAQEYLQEFIAKIKIQVDGDEN